MVEDVGRSYGEIRDDLKDEFDAKDHWQIGNDGRDDVEAYEAALSILDTYKMKDGSFAGQYIPAEYRDRGEVRKEYSDLKEKLLEEKNYVEKNTMHFLGNAYAHIDTLASRINDAENEVYYKILNMRERIKITDCMLCTSLGVDDPNKIKNEYMERTIINGCEGLRFLPIKVSSEFDELYDSDMGVELEIAMEGFVRHMPNEQYEIDYSYCENQVVRSYINSITGSDKAIIKYNSTYKKFVILSNAPAADNWDDSVKGFGYLPGVGWLAPHIYGGETLQTLASQALAIQEAQRDELLARIDYNELYKTKADAQQLIDMIKGQPALYNALNEKDKLLEFVIKSETRLDDIIIKYKKQGNEPDFPEPITGIGMFHSGLLKAKFKGPDAEMIVFAGKETESQKGTQRLPSDLYDILDDKDDELKEYLNERFKTKWNELDYYAYRENVFDRGALGVLTNFSGDFGIDIDGKQLENGLFALEHILSALRHFASKGYNPYLTKLHNYCKDVYASLNGQVSITKDQGQAVVFRLQQLFIEYKNNDNKLASLSDYDAISYIHQIFSDSCVFYPPDARVSEGITFTDKKEQILYCIRQLGLGMTVGDNASTESVTAEVETRLLSKSEDIQLRDRNCEASVKKINEMYQVDIDSEGNITPSSKQANIDDLYNNLDKPQTFVPAGGNENWQETYNGGAAALYLYLQQKGILPGNTLDYKDSRTAYLYSKGDGPFPKWDRLGSSMRTCIETMYKSLKTKKAESKKTIQSNDIKDSLQREIDSYKKDGIVTAEEAERIAINECIMKDSEVLNELAKEQTEYMRTITKYCGVSAMIHNCISGKLIEYGRGFRGNSELQQMYNDAKGYGGLFDFTDDNCEAIGDNALEIIVDVLVSVAISMVGGRAVTHALRAAKLGKLGKWVKKIITLTEKVGSKIANGRFGRVIQNLATNAAEATIEGVIREGKVDPLKVAKSAVFGTVKTYLNIGTDKGLDYLAKTNCTLATMTPLFKKVAPGLVGGVKSVVVNGNNVVSGATILEVSGILSKLDELNIFNKVVAKVGIENQIDVVLNVVENGGVFNRLDMKIGTEIISVSSDGKIKSGMGLPRRLTV